MLAGTLLSRDVCEYLSPVTVTPNSQENYGGLSWSMKAHQILLGANHKEPCRIITFQQV